MRKFSDANGREWIVGINIAQARRLKEAIGLDLLDPENLQHLAADPYTAANVLYVLCQKQCETAQITDEQFGEALAGDAFEQAVTALLNEIVDFFPKHHRGPMRAILAQLDKTIGQTAAMVEQKATSPEMEATLATILARGAEEIDRKLAELTAGSSSGSAPGQPA